MVGQRTVRSEVPPIARVAPVADVCDLPVGRRFEIDDQVDARVVAGADVTTTERSPDRARRRRPPDPPRSPTAPRRIECLFDLVVCRVVGRQRVRGERHDHHPRMEPDRLYPTLRTAHLAGLVASSTWDSVAQDCPNNPLLSGTVTRPLPPQLRRADVRCRLSVLMQARADGSASSWSRRCWGQ